MSNIENLERRIADLEAGRQRRGKKSSTNRESKTILLSSLKDFPEPGSEDGSFFGKLSPYGGDPDSYGDICEKGCYTKTIKEQGNTRLLLFNHDQSTILGSVQLSDQSDGLYVRGQLLLDPSVPKSAEIYAFLKAGLLNGLSIGYQCLQSFYDENDYRHLTEVKLYEASVVAFPAADSARISSVKNTLTEGVRLLVNGDPEEQKVARLRTRLRELVRGR